MFNAFDRSPIRRIMAGGLLFLALAVLLVGCWNLNLKGKPDPSAAPPPQPAKFIPSYDDTLGAYADVPTDQYILIRGYGLALMPQKTGSRECPPGIRKLITDQLSRMGVGQSTSLLSSLTPTQWVESMNTAVVEVSGMMPAGGLKNQTFDVRLLALPGTQTTSLEGGTLLTTELSVWRRGRAGTLIHGNTLAIASGTIFINPFADQIDLAGLTSQPANAAAPIGTPADPRAGIVLGGAIILRDQPLNVVFHEQNHRLVSIAQEMLNSAFPSPYLNGIAHGKGANTLELRVPPDYRDQVNFWLALVQQTLLRREPGFQQQRLAQLTDELTWPDHTDRERLRAAVTLIGFGRPALPILQKLYSDESPAVAFHAAYAGLRIGDSLALRVMLSLIKDKNHPYRLSAIYALGQPHKFPNIGSNLTPLLDEENPEIRTVAFQSASRLGVAVVRSELIGLENLDFALDSVHCNGPNLIFVTRSQRPRIVVFGDELRLVKPAFIHNRRTGVTLSAKITDDQLTLMRPDPATGKVGTIQTTFLVIDLIRKLGAPSHRNEKGDLIGLGLNYAQVVHVLNHLVGEGAIGAKLYLQPLATRELTNESPLPVKDEAIEQDSNLTPETPTTSRPDGRGIDVEPPTGRPRIGS